MRDSPTFGVVQSSGIPPTPALPAIGASPAVPPVIGLVPAVPPLPAGDAPALDPPEAIGEPPAPPDDGPLGGGRSAEQADNVKQSGIVTQAGRPRVVPFMIAPALADLRCIGFASVEL